MSSTLYLFFDVMKKYILSFLTVFMSVMFSYSQEIIEYKGDTAVIISPENLKTINSIIVEHESTLKELDLYKESLLVDSAIIANKDSIILSKNDIIIKKDQFYTESMKNLVVSLDNEKRKHRKTKKILGGTGAVAIVVSIILLCGR